jgi:hypothetical protein
LRVFSQTQSKVLKPLQLLYILQKSYSVIYPTRFKVLLGNRLGTAFSLSEPLIT